MNKLKKYLSFALSLLMIISAIFSLSLTASALASKGKCGNKVNYTFKSSTGELTINGKGEMNDYEGDSPFDGNSKIKKVNIENGVTRIGGGSFYNCKGITSVSIGNSVEILNDCSFANCSSLKSISIPDKVFYIGYHAFVGCTGLEKVIFGSNTEVINDGSFENCKSLSSVYIGKKVDYIGGDAFLNCKKMKNVYYAGSKKQWKAIEVGANNECLKNAKIHYNSPYPTSISKITSRKKGFSVKWKKVNSTTGYQIQYATDSKFTKNKKTVGFKGAKTTSKTIKGLKGNKKYYVRIRTYKTVKGTKCYSPWSKTKTFTTKK